MPTPRHLTTPAHLPKREIERHGTVLRIIHGRELPVHSRIKGSVPKVLALPLNHPPNIQRRGCMACVGVVCHDDFGQWN